MMQDRLMSAFSARSLQDTTDFSTEYSMLINEDGAPDPSAMGVTAKMTMGDDTQEWPTMKITFLAKGGKQDDLIKSLKKVWKGILKTGPKDDADDMKKLVDITGGKDNKVYWNMKFPKGPQESDADKDLKAAFKEHKPTFSASVQFGRTIEQMYNNLNSNVLVLPKGISAKIGASFASTAFEAAGDLVPPDARKIFKILSGFTKFSASEKVLYKSEADLGDSFSDIPSFDREIHSMAQEVANGPKAVTKHLKDLGDVTKGITQIKIVGLPMGWQVVANFDNFHPHKVLSSMVA